MRVLVAGASGEVGSRLCHALRERGDEVHGAARFSDPRRAQALEADGVQLHRFDVRRDDPRELPEVDLLFLELWKPAHLLDAERQDPADVWDLNYHAIGRLVARYAGTADVINGSTGSVYGPRADRPSREDDLPRPDSHYALARFAQEQLIGFLCDEAGSKCAQLRYFIGNSPSSGVLPRMARSIAAGESLGPDPDRRLQVIAIEDFARCTLAVADKLTPEPFCCNVCHPQVWTMRELAERLQSELGRGGVRFERENGGGDGSVCGDTERMRAEFGEPVVALDELIARICAAVD